MRRLEERYTILIVTHNMAQARRTSDRCVFMLMGEVIEQASTLDMFLRPSQRQTELYVEGRYG
jgi:phosphate transport system ATP-binding protein